MNVQTESNELSAAFSLISYLWLHEISLPVLSELNQTSIKTLLEEFGGHVPEANEPTIEQLAIEYCALLVGPKGHLSPIQSVWEDNKFQGEPATSMLEFFKIVPGYDAPAKFVDHIGVQLDFVANLLAGEVVEADEDEENTINELIADFSRRHLKWTAPFLKQVESRSSSAFYKGLASVTRHLINEI